ncbi:MAG TPA: hypothetical protein VFU20_04810 [Sphingomicrobium sp.]|nr:hypothetical protein [Sphingomicrobium sp.]
MTRTPLAIALAAAAALAGCNQQEVTLNTGLEDNVATNDVVLPPSIAASKIYRCKDNSVVYIDWLSDNRSANVRTDRNAPPTHLVAPEAGQPMVAEGYSLTGAAADSSVTLTRPGKGSQSCKA